MFDLALELSTTPSALAKKLTEREFGDFGRYAEQHGLPWRRVELLLARIAMFLDVGLLGEKNARLGNYLDFNGTRQNEEMADEMEDLFGGGGTVIQMKRVSNGE